MHPVSVAVPGSAMRYFGGGGRGLLLPDSEQSLYQEMFESVWDGDLEAVKHMTTKRDDKDRLLVCVQDSAGLTPLALAAFRGHAEIVTLLIRVATEQYTPIVRIGVYLYLFD